MGKCLWGICLATAVLAAGCGLRRPATAPLAHPYPLRPTTDQPGRTGTSAPMVVELRQQYEQALADGDRAAAKEALELIAGESFQWGHPEFLPYEGSVEHVRGSLQRYIPPYPLYNDRTLAANFVLHRLAQTRAARVDFAENVYWHTQYGLRIPAQTRAEPVSCYPWRPGESIRLEVGRLPARMMYAVRVIGALDTRDLSDPRVFRGPAAQGPEKQLVFQMEVNDRPDGSTSTYILRGRATDNFYQVVCLMFPGLDDRRHVVTLTLLPESEATLYTYNIDVHNVFGQCARVAGKPARTFSPPPAVGAPAALDPSARAERDRALWRSLPPINLNYDSVSGRQAAAGWEGPDHDRQWDQGFELHRRDPDTGTVERFSREDLEARRPLPGSGDRGAGVVLAQPGQRHLGSFIGHQAFGRYRAVGLKLRELIDRYKIVGDRAAARDAAFLLAALAYQYPAIQPDNALSHAETGTPEQPMRRYGPGDDLPGGWGPFEPWKLIVIVDELFDFTHDNDELAQALGRFIPWVKSPRDVQFLYEVYLVQYTANEIMHFRYYYDHSQPSMLIQAAVIQADNAITRSWMDFLQARAWEYPQMPAGLDEQVVTNTGRDGTSTTGSWYYAQSAAPGLATILDMRAYLRAGGLEAYDVADFTRYPKPLAWMRFLLDSRVAGSHALGVGDVGGPSVPLGAWAESLARQAEPGWRLTGDPRFAWLLVHQAGDPRTSRRLAFTRQQWTAIEQAAAGRRAPMLETRSRVLPDWSAILEAGTQHDDVRLRRALALRVGNGLGHAHNDTLDLRLWAYGAIMAGDLGQFPGQGQPEHATTYLHNLVEVDGDGAPADQNTGNWDGYALVRNLFDAPGAAYIRAESQAPANHRDVRLMRRQVALIDADAPAAPTAPTGTEPPATDGAEAPTEPAEPGGYVFDVVRVAGGRRHTYCFHGCVDDNELGDGGFEVNAVNLRTVAPDEDSPAGRYLRQFDWSSRRARQTGRPVAELDDQWVADVDGQVLQATWRLGRGAERRMFEPAGVSLTPQRKYTRLHLMDAAGLLLMHGIAADVNDAGKINPDVPNYAGRCLFAQRQANQPIESAFVALIEPYAAQPVIASRRTLDIAENETDALRAVAVEVQTAAGHADLCFSDGRPFQTRRVEGSVEVAGEFAFVSRDAAGLRQATLTGGTLLKTAELELRVLGRQYFGEVAQVDYANRVAYVRGIPPLEELEGLTFQIGNEQHGGSFLVERVAPSPQGTALHVRDGLEMMRARVMEVDRPAGRVRTNVAMLHYPGRDRALTATGEDPNRTWRARFDGGNRHEGFWFTLAGDPLGPDDFPVGSKLSVWEFGPADTVALRTGVSLRRTDRPGVWEVYTNTPFAVAMPGAIIQWSPDEGRSWRPLPPGGQLGPGRGQPTRFHVRARAKP